MTDNKQDFENKVKGIAASIHLVAQEINTPTSTRQRDKLFAIEKRVKALTALDNLIDKEAFVEKLEAMKTQYLKEHVRDCVCDNCMKVHYKNTTIDAAIKLARGE